jgi:hypothetical protein
VFLIAWMTAKRKRSQRKARTEHLREQFGSEYDRTVSEKGRSDGEEELVHREQEVAMLELRPLGVDEATRYTAAWNDIQAHFVDFPGEAVLRADRLVAEVMQARGYPALGFNERTAAVSVDHPRAVQEYRAAREIALRSQRNRATTEELRQAMMGYRSVFHEMAEVSTDASMNGHASERDIPVGAPGR